MSLMNKGFLAGDNLEDRLERLLGDPRRLPGLIPTVAARVNEFLAEAAALVRERFGGKVTYAAIQLERVDWTGFDIVSLDDGTVVSGSGVGRPRMGCEGKR